MSGFALPKLRWLLAGAVAAGIWVAVEESGKPRPSVPVGDIGKLMPARQAFSLPERVGVPPRRPGDIVTGAVPRAAVEGLTQTTTRVKLRQRASIDAPVVARIEAGETLRSLAASGEWRLVSAGGRKGWVQLQYLGRIGPQDARRASARSPDGKNADQRVPKGADRRAAESPRRRPLDQFRVEPRVDVGLAKAAMRERRPEGLRRPVRAPQGGDCQCPYDLMLDGSECGERSAYVLKGPGYALCYR